MDKCRALEASRRSGSRFGSLGRILIPSATVFFTGGCVAILVLAASRLVARSLGSSLYTWSSVAGVVLAGLSLGHYLGGRLADRYHARRVLAMLFGLASAACIAMIISNNLADRMLWLWRLSWPSHVFLHVGLVFFPFSILLGAVSPVAVRMAVGGTPAKSSEMALGGVVADLGRTIGSIYAWGAVGGLAGVLLAGFFLIAVLGNTALVWLIGMALLVMAVLYWVSCWAMYLWAMVFLALATMGMAGQQWAQDTGAAAGLREWPDPNIVYEVETPYGHLAVRQIAQRPDRRALVLDNGTLAEMAINDATGLTTFYRRVFAGLTRGRNGDRKDPAMLVLGAGGYTFPRHLKAVWPGSRIEVVEIDPGVTQAAWAALGLEKAAGIEIVHADAKSYLDWLANAGRQGTGARRYDFVYQDALCDGEAALFPLVTREFNDKVAGLLAADGVYLIHLADTRQDGWLLGAVVNTVRQTFPCVYAIAGDADPAAPGNSFVVVAARRALDVQAILATEDKHLVFSVLENSELDRLRELCSSIVLTDDYAPVENLSVPAVQQAATGILARKYLDRARQLQRDNQYEQSIEWYRHALDTDPALAVPAYEQIGLMQVARNRREEAVSAFRKAIAAHADDAGRQTAIGSVHLHLGTLLGRMDRVKEAKAELTRAVKAFRVELEDNPGAVVTWERLGDTAATLGDFNGAAEAFDKAVALEPRNPSHYQKLARALEFEHRYDEAVAVVRKHVELMRGQGEREAVTQLNHYINLLEYKKVKQAGRGTP